ncbi:uncharacterized protein [Diadema antillarum]|uniref:uncharacterized protein n=1 Tax=Diadema antillarum TaxID=105358 RepID=UPI003A849D39
MDNVHVAIRARPFIKREKDNDAKFYWKTDTNTVQQIGSQGKHVGKPYTFDRVFVEDETTQDVYEEIAQPIVESAMDGYDGTIFAYGQTASGKTYTMQGNNMCPGIIPSTVQEIFDTIENTPDREFLLRVSYLELYNESLTDLLCDEKKQLSIRENGERVYVSNLTEEVTTSIAQILGLMKKGDARRHVGRTNMNEHSSRSHTIFCMIIESRGRSQKGHSVDGAVKVSHLNLVDLAGSERANETKAEGARLKEACIINQSLFTLGSVINRLASGSDFIPFRDSKLTRILQSSLGGNAKTAIICTITAASLEQTQSTLQFATRAKTIKNKPVMNEILSDEALMQRMKTEIQELKKKLEGYKDQTTTALTNGEVEALLLQEKEKVKAEVMQEMNKKLDYFNNHLVVSKGGTQPKLKRKARRETWCPGMRKGVFMSPGPMTRRAMGGPSSVDVSMLSLPGSVNMSQSSVDSNSPSSISSSEFNEEASHNFRHEILSSSEGVDIDPFDLDLGQPSKPKRRRANVRFAEDVEKFMSEEYSRDAASQTDPVEAATPEAKSEEDEDLQQAFEGAMSELISKDSEINEMKAAVSQSEQQLLEALTALETTQKEKEQLQERLESRETIEFEDNDVLSADINKLKEELAQAKSELKQKTEEFIELQEFTRLEGTTQKDQEIQYQHEIERLHQLISLGEQASKEIEDKMKAQLTQAQNEKTDVEYQLSMDRERNKSMISELRQQLQEAYDKLSGMEGRTVIEDLQKGMEAEKEKVAESERKLAAMKEDMDKLQELAAARSAEFDAVKCELSQKSEEVKKVQELMTLESSMLKEQEEKIRAEVTQALSDKGDLEHQLTIEKERSESLISELRLQLQEAYTRLEQREGEGATDDSQAQDKVRESEVRLAALQDEMDALLKSSTEKAAELEAVKMELGQKSEEVSGLQDFVTQQTQNFEEQEAQSRHEIKRLHELLTLSEAEMKEIEDDIRAQLDRVQKEKDAVESQLSQERSLTFDLRQQLQESSDGEPSAEGGAVSEDLQSLLEAEQEKVRESAIRLAATQEEMESLQASLKAELKDLEDKMQGHLSQAQCDRADLEGQLSRERELTTELHQRIQELVEKEVAGGVVEMEQEEKTTESAERLAALQMEMDALRESSAAAMKDLEDKMQAQLAQLQDEKTELETQLSMERQQHESLISELRIQLQEACSKSVNQEEGTMTEELRRQVELEQEKVTTAEARLAAVQKDMEALQESMHAQIANIEDEMQVKLQQAEGEVTNLKLQLTTDRESSELVTADLRRQLRESYSKLENEEAGAIVEELRREVELSKEKLAESEARQATMKSEMETVQDLLSAAMEGSLSLEKLQEQLTQAQTEKAELQHQLGVDKEQYESLASELRQQLQEACSKLGEREDLQKLLELEQEKLKEVETRLADLQQEIETSQQLLEAEMKDKESLEELQEQLTQAQTEKAELQHQLGVDKEQYESLASELRQQLQEACSKLGEREDLQKLLELEQEKLKEAETRLADLQQEIETSQQSLEGEIKDKESEKLQEQLTQAQTEKAELQHQLGVDKEQYESLASELGQQLQEACSKLGEREDLQKQLELEQEKLKEAETRLADLQQEIETSQQSEMKDKESLEKLHEQLTQAQTEKAELQHQLGVDKEQYESLASELRQQLQEACSKLGEREDLQKQLELEQEKLKEAETRLADLQQEIETSQQSLEAEMKDKESLEELQEQLTQAQTEKAELQHQLGVDKEQYESLASELRQQLQEACSKLGEREDLQKQLELEQEKLKEAETRLADLQQEMETSQQLLEAGMKDKENEMCAQLTLAQKERSALAEELKVEQELTSDLRQELHETCSKLGKALAGEEIVQEKVKKSEMRLADLQDELVAAQDEAIERVADFEAVKTQLAEKTEEVLRLQEFMEHENSKAEEQEAQSRHEIQRLHDLLQTSETEVKEIEDQVSAQLAKTQKEKSDLEHQLSEEKERMASLTSELRQQLQEAQNKSDGMAESEVKLANVQSELEALQKTAIERTAELDAAQTALKEKSEELLRLQQLKALESEKLEEQENAQTEGLQAVLKTKEEELGQLTDEIRDLKNDKEALEKWKAKAKEELRRVRRDAIIETTRTEGQYRSAVLEMEAELDVEKAKAKEAQQKLETQTKRVCELEAQLKQGQPSGDEVASLKSEVASKNWKLKKMEMDSVRQTVQLEERVKELENEKQYLEKTNRQLKTEMRRMHEKAADSSVLSSANYPEAGVCGSSSAYDIAFYSLRAENESLKRKAQQADKKTEKMDKEMETLKLQRDEQVTRNTRLKEEVLYLRERMEKVKTYFASKHVESRETQPLQDSNSETPGLRREHHDHIQTKLLPSSVSAGREGNLDISRASSMFDALKGNDPEEDKPECTTQ